MSAQPDRAEEARNKHEDKQQVEVTVFAPRSPDGREFTWNKHMSVADAAQDAATAFGYGAGTFTLAKGETTLDRTKQLVAAGVRDGDELQLVDTGGGV
jgi:hypothetical protein